MFPLTLTIGPGKNPPTPQPRHQHYTRLTHWLPKNTVLSQFPNPGLIHYYSSKSTTTHPTSTTPATENLQPNHWHLSSLNVFLWFPRKLTSGTDFTNPPTPPPSKNHQIHHRKPLRTDLLALQTLITALLQYNFNTILRNDPHPWHNFHQGHAQACLWSTQTPLH